MKNSKNSNTKLLAIYQLTNTLLSQQNRHLTQKLVFSNLQASTKNTPKINISQSLDPEQKNKALYFQYVAQVLQKKEQELLEWQKQLQSKEQEFNQKTIGNQIMAKIKFIEEIKNTERRMKNLGKIICEDNNVSNSQYFEEFEKMSQEVQRECSKFKANLQTEFKEFYEEITAQRMILRKKISQFAELSAYEKYLNQLHDALELRNSELTRSEESLKTIMNNSESLNVISDHSNKKRHRIFDNKTYKSKDQQSKNSQQIFWQQNQTFAENQSKLSHQKFVPIEQSTQKDSLPSQKNQLSEEIKTSYKNHPYTQHYNNSHVLQIPADTASIGVQFHSQSQEETLIKLENSKKICKFLKLWFKFCFKKSHISWKKIFLLYIWRANTVFDGQIPNKLKIVHDKMDNIWGKHKDKLIRERVLPLDGLSLKKTKYSQLYLEHMYKIFHREKIQKLLVSILRNRNRKERLTFYFYFIRLYNNSMQLSKLKRIQNKDQITPSHSQIRLQSQIATPNCKTGRNIGLKKKTPSKQSNNHSLKQNQSRTKLKEIQDRSNIKQNKPTGMNPKDQIAQLKSYIDQKERIQKLLATQCVKMQGLIKMTVVMSGISNRVNSDFFNILASKNFEDRIQSLSSHITALQFRLELILTKCRLGLANNNQKLSALQDLLGFTHFMK